MNTDIRLKIGFTTSPKTLKLKRRLGADGVLCLISLWLWAAQDKPNGVLDGKDIDDIELAAGWNGEPGEFAKALVDLRWLETAADGTYCLHGWEEHQDWASKADERAEKARTAAQARWAKKESKEEQCPNQSEHMHEHMHEHKDAYASADAPLLSSPYLSLPKEEENTYSAKSAPQTPSSADALPASGDAEHPHEGEKLILKGKKKTLRDKRASSFIRVWEAFDWKKGKADAIDAWAAIPSLNDALVDRIVAAAQRYAIKREEIIRNGGTPKWLQGWIASRRWEDEDEAPAPARRGGALEAALPQLFEKKPVQEMRPPVVMREPGTMSLKEYLALHPDRNNTAGVA